MPHCRQAGCCGSSDWLARIPRQCIAAPQKGRHAAAAVPSWPESCRARMHMRTCSSTFALPCLFSAPPFTSYWQASRTWGGGGNRPSKFDQAQCGLCTLAAGSNMHQPRRGGLRPWQKYYKTLCVKQAAEPTSDWHMNWDTASPACPAPAAPPPAPPGSQILQDTIREHRKGMFRSRVILILYTLREWKVQALALMDSTRGASNGPKKKQARFSLRCSTTTDRSSMHSWAAAL